MKTPFRYIRLNYKSALAGKKSSDDKRQNVISIRGLFICYILVLESFLDMSYSFFILNIDYSILFASNICILLFKI